MKLSRQKPSTKVSREVTIVNELGLHARPAARFVKCANAFESEIWLIREGERFSGMSLMEILRADLDQGTRLTLEAEGPDADAAITQLETLLASFREEGQLTP
jgi:phosphocarrier protein